MSMNMTRLSYGIQVSKVYGSIRMKFSNSIFSIRPLVSSRAEVVVF